MRLNDARLSAYEASIVVFMGIFRWNYNSIPEVSSSSHGEGLTSGNADCSLGPRDRRAWKGRGYLHPVTSQRSDGPCIANLIGLSVGPGARGQRCVAWCSERGQCLLTADRFTTVSNFEGSFLEFFIGRSDHHTLLSQRVAPLVFVTMHSYSQKLFLRYISFRKCS